MCIRDRLGVFGEAVDVVAADIKNDTKIIPLSFISCPINKELAQRTRRLQNESQSLYEFGCLNNEFAHIFSSAINTLIKQDIHAAQAKAIGLHGQTLLHVPGAQYPFTIQLGNPNIVAAKTGLQTIADFRNTDMACGGQGAPLTPAFHAHAFSNNGDDKAVVNIGGIANITILSAQGKAVAGFDIGPGNCLMDTWIRHHHNKEFDSNGEWAASAVPDFKLLDKLLNDTCLLYTSPSPRDRTRSRMPSSA